MFTHWWTVEGKSKTKQIFLGFFLKYMFVIDLFTIYKKFHHG